MCINGVLHQNQYPIAAMGAYGRNRSPNANMAGAVHMNQDAFLNAVFSPSNNAPNPKLTSVATFSNIVSSEASADMESAMQPHLHSFQPPISFKVTSITLVQSFSQLYEILLASFIFCALQRRIVGQGFCLLSKWMVVIQEQSQ